MQADGMDVMAVKAAGEKAIAHCRNGGGPIIVEMMTYRYRGHSMSDPAKYRTKEEVQKIRKERDPIDYLREVLLDKKLTDENSLKELDRKVKGIVSDSAEFAQQSLEPDSSELYKDVLIEVSGN
jgi:pyruvate dehydrogenase E1 component alpha subunit